MANHYLALSRAEASKSSIADPSELEGAWRSGNLRCLLQPHQQPVYDDIKTWVRDPPSSVECDALYDSIYVLDIARRFGKTALCLILLYEWALTLPAIAGRGVSLTYATREKDQIKRIVLPLHRMLTRGAPHDIRPKYHGTHDGLPEGLYFDQSQSVIKLVGVDKDPDRLLGEGSDGGVFSEAGHMKDLKENITSMFLPQFQRRPWARLILESTAPKEQDHDFEHFVEDAKKRRAHKFGTLDDNTTLSQEEKDKALREAGGKDSIVARREYYGIRERDPESTVIPEFDLLRHVRRIETPEYACAMNSQDPGSRDLFGLLWAYWHSELDILVVQRSWAKRNAGIEEVARILLDGNAELWEGERPVRWWDGPEEHMNPALSVSDIDPLLQRHMNVEHGMHVVSADKRISHTGIGEAKLYQLRDAFKNDKIAILPDSGPLASHCEHARWNDKRTDLARHKEYGHFDCMKALAYLWGRLGRWRNVNPRPPAGIFTGRESDRVFGPNYVPPMSQAEKLSQAVFGKDIAMHKHPAPGLVAPKRPPLSRCGICRKWRRCETWMEAGGSYVCSIECSDKWTYRATAGKPPPHVLAARERAAATAKPPPQVLAELEQHDTPDAEPAPAQRSKAGLVLVQPHGETGAQLAALDACLQQLTGGGRLERDSVGNYAHEEGWYRALCADADFVVYAIEKQGYARAARRE